MRLRLRRRRPEWTWPAELATYADAGPQLAVAFRVVINHLQAHWPDRTVFVPDWMFDGALNQLPPIARYMSMPHANRGLDNFLLKGVVVLRETPPA